MDMRKFGTTKTFITVAELRDNGPREEILVAREDGQYGKPVAIFESGRKLTLNATNTDILIKAYGADDADWIGVTIELHVGLIPYNGNDIDSVIVEPVTPPKPIEARTPVPKPPTAKKDMNDDIPF